MNNFDEPNNGMKELMEDGSGGNLELDTESIRPEDKDFDVAKTAIAVAQRREIGGVVYFINSLRSV